MKTQAITSFDEWATFCSSITYALRCLLHSILKSSPGSAVFGRNMLFDIDHITAKETTKNNDRENSKRIAHNYSPGDLIRINLTGSFQSKMAPATVGPFSAMAVREMGQS
ncbi:hypothetical protein AC1031_021682 [Aphanomyces cochlioides]|nr:hypothetical protein AC1031_021682 [Aphanomyces cochlioides]